MANIQVKDLGQLAQYLAQLALNSKGLEQRLVRATALYTHGGCVDGTPVNTGKARSNWIVTLGRPWTGVNPPFAPGVMLGRGETANANATKVMAAAVITARAPGTSVFITNNAPYIGELNQGKSPQSPPAFIEAAIQDGMQKAGVTTQFYFAPGTDPLAPGHAGWLPSAPPPGMGSTLGVP